MAKKILVVDDSWEIRALVESVLTANDFEVISVSDGVKALNYLQSNRLPDLIILDIEMPNMDGWEFRKKQCAHPENRKVPVIIHSSELNIEIIANKLEVEGFVSKTDGYEKLLQVIRQSLSTSMQDYRRE